MQLAHRLVIHFGGLVRCPVLEQARSPFEQRARFLVDQRRGNLEPRRPLRNGLRILQSLQRDLHLGRGGVVISSVSFSKTR